LKIMQHGVVPYHVIGAAMVVDVRTESMTVPRQFCSG
jgi:hypothetical protein